MGALRLYAVGIGEVHAIFGAQGEDAQRLRDQAQLALAPPSAERSGLLSRLGPIFRRPPGMPVLDPDDPVPGDLDRLLTGSYIPSERSAASWRLLELLIKENAWGRTSLSLTGEEMDGLDFALARGGVHAAAGLRHLVTSPTELPMIRPSGLLVGYQPGVRASWMADCYRAALSDLESPVHRDLAEQLANWLDGFVHWNDVAPTLDRPAPDVVGFWGVS